MWLILNSPLVKSEHIQAVELPNGICSFNKYRVQMVSETLLGDNRKIYNLCHYGGHDTEGR